MNKDRKKLLNENTIRRMMKLAEIDSLSETFIGDKFTVSENYPPEEQEDDPVAEEMGEEAPFDPEAEAPVDLPPEPDVGEEGPPAEVSITDEEASTLASVLEKLLAAQGEGEGEEDFPAEEPAELDMAPEDEELPPGGGGYAMAESIEKKEEEEETLEEDAEDEETLEEETDEDLQERLTNEIARRVAARLTKESRQEKVADQLAERILHRLKNG
jgi:hypothetical protein